MQALVCDCETCILLEAFLMLKSVNIRMDLCVKGCGFCFLLLTFDVTKRNQNNFTQICFLIAVTFVLTDSTVHLWITPREVFSRL